MCIPDPRKLVLGLILALAVHPETIFGQYVYTLSECAIYKVYSENERFYLASVPFDDRAPSLRGKTAVYQVGRPAPLYSLDRPFHEPFAAGGVFLSNDGTLILSVLASEAQDTVPGLKSITVYKNGRLARDFTAAEVTRCDARKERCDLVYSNDEQVIDRERSRSGTADYHKVFKEGVSAEERFLSDFAVFASGDTVYVTDSRKRVHRFTLQDGSPAPDQSFDAFYPELRAVARRTKTEQEAFACKPAFPKLTSGLDAGERLASILGLKAVDESGADDRYRIHRVFVTGVLSRDGTFIPDKLDILGRIDRQKVEAFFAHARFDTAVIPAPCDRWYFGLHDFAFRNPDAGAARREKRAEIADEKREFERRLTLDVINGVYIPKDLGDCLAELDRRLTDVDKAEMRAKPTRQDMIEYHMGLGMWLRNNWGLWGGSRLQKYFADRHVTHPDDMSALILDCYWDWLHGDKEGWRNWEKTWRNRIPPDPPPPVPLKKK